MKKTVGGNHLTKLCTKFGVNPKMLSGSKSGGFVWDGQTDGQSENNIHSASRVYKKSENRRKKKIKVKKKKRKKRKK